MQMHHMRTPCSFVQIIDVLGYNVNIELLLQFGNGSVRRVRTSIQHLFSSLVVEVKHQTWIAFKSLRRSNIFDLVFLPEPITVPEGPQPAFRAYTSTREKNEVH